MEQLSRQLSIYIFNTKSRENREENSFTSYKKKDEVGSADKEKMVGKFAGK